MHHSSRSYWDQLALRQQELLYGLCRRLLYFIVALIVAMMHHGPAVSQSRELERSVGQRVDATETPGGVRLSSLTSKFDFFEWISTGFLPQFSSGFNSLTTTATATRSAHCCCATVLH